MTRKERIYQQLQQLNPVFLDVEDESHRHHVPRDAQTHYKVTLVAEQFNQQSRVARHRQINALLKEEFATGLHALSLHLYTPDEWQTKGINLVDSPACRDGYDF